MHSGDVMSDCSNLVFYGVVWKKIDGCIGSVCFAEYVSFKAGRF